MGICQGCHAGCCRSFAIPLTGADILTIERDTGQTFWGFGCRWADPAGTIAANYAPHFHFQDEPQTPFVICLKQQESQTFPGTSKCGFLRETAPDAEHPLGEGNCGIYQSRPAACRAFPTKFDSQSQLPILHSVPEYGRDEKKPQYRLCPRQWTPDDVDPVEVARDLAVAHYEANFFRQIAGLWNRQPGSWTIFPEFLRDVYRNRIQPVPEQTETDNESPPVLKFSDYQNGLRRCA